MTRFAAHDLADVADTLRSVFPELDDLSDAIWEDKAALVIEDLATAGWWLLPKTEAKAVKRHISAIQEAIVDW